LLGDSFSISGLAGLIGVLFIIIKNEGYFDLISYGVKRVFKASFNAKYKQDMPQTYLEYREAMKDKRKPSSLPFLIMSCSFFVVGCIFIILYYFVPLS
jgi:hypothetical protein